MSNTKEKYSKKTKYDTSKQTKADNYKYLNEKYPPNDCTVIIGDSIVELWNNELFRQYTRLSGQEIINRGISGDTSDRMYLRLEENAVNLKPRNIVILIGTNDLGHGIPADFTVLNVENSIKLIKSGSPETNIVLLSALPVNKNVGILNRMVGRRTNEALSELNRSYKELCEKYAVTFLDITERLKDEKGRFDKKYTYDGLHPNIRGYIAITPELIALLK